MALGSRPDLDLRCADEVGEAGAPASFARSPFGPLATSDVEPRFPQNASDFAPMVSHV